MKFLVLMAVWVGLVANAKAHEIEFSPSSDPEILRILADTLDYKDIGDALIAWEDVNSDGEKELFFYDETRKCVEHLCTAYVLQKRTSSWRLILEAPSGDMSLSADKTNGYRAIKVHFNADPEIFREFNATYSWNGEKYEEVSREFSDAYKDIKSVQFQSLDSIKNPAIRNEIKQYYATEFIEAAENNSAIETRIAPVELSIAPTADQYFIAGLQSTFHCGNYSCACEVLRYTNQQIIALKTNGLWCETNNEETNVYLLDGFSKGLHDIAFQDRKNTFHTLRWNGNAYFKE